MFESFAIWLDSPITQVVLGLQIAPWTNHSSIQFYTDTFIWTLSN